MSSYVPVLSAQALMAVARIGPAKYPPVTGHGDAHRRASSGLAIFKRHIALASRRRSTCSRMISHTLQNTALWASWDTAPRRPTAIGLPTVPGASIVIRPSSR
jgi:hypothetical protein